MVAYQPLWRDGQQQKPGERECADRYAMIREVLQGAPAPFSFLDIGANVGYFSARLLEDFDCHGVAIDSTPELLELHSTRLFVLGSRVNWVELQEMPRYDVVLALSVLHHFPKWRRVLNTIRASRFGAIVEIPHPNEKWMRVAAARQDVVEMYDTVSELPGARLLGTSERKGRDGHTYGRPLYFLPGTLVDATGQVFAGSGSCSRNLQPNTHAKGIDRVLGYQPYPGSLNLRVGLDLVSALGEPVIDWRSPKKRQYLFWPAWIDGRHFVHAMDPAGRSHRHSIEVCAADRLRDRFHLQDGDRVNLLIQSS